VKTEEARGRGQQKLAVSRRVVEKRLSKEVADAIEMLTNKTVGRIATMQAIR